MEQSIQALYPQYQADVYYYLLGLSHNQTIAEDLTSETFLAAIRALPTFRGEASPKTWLFSIARYQWFAHLRKEKKEQSILEQLELSNVTTNPEDSVANQMLTSRILELLDLERPVAKEVVRLRLEGYSFYEIGQQVAISENSARVIDFRTRKKLKDRLVKEGLYHG